MADSLEHTVYNIGAGYPIYNKDLEAAVKKAIPEADIEFNDGKGPAHKEDGYMDSARLESLGFKQKWSVEDAFADYVGWLKAGNEK